MISFSRFWRHCDYADSKAAISTVRARSEPMVGINPEVGIVEIMPRSASPLLDHDQPSRHHRAVSGRQSVRRQSRADARRVSGLQGADRAYRRRRPRACDRALGHAIVAARLDGSDQETRREARSQGQAGRLQATAPDGAGLRHHQHPQRDEQTLDAMAGSGAPLRGALQLVQRVQQDRGRRRLVRARRDPPDGLLRRHLARPSTTSTHSSPRSRMPRSAPFIPRQCR
jgi:hypothetical protein